MSSPGTLAGLVRTPAAHDVDFVLIGGLAVAAHGYTRATDGVDIVYSTEIENGPLDALSATRGQTYGKLSERALTTTLADGTEVLVCSRADLIESKRASGRPQDLADLEGLAAVEADAD